MKAEVTEEPDNQSPAADQPAAPPPAVAPHRRKRTEYIAEGFRNKTKGESQFNFLTYTGVGYFGVTLGSVFMTWLLHDSPAFAKPFQQFVEKVATKFRGNPKDKLVHSVMNILTLFLGGSIISVFPVKWLEDAKPDIVKHFDQFNYSKQELENDPLIKAAHQELDETPKQTWWSVINSRLVAFIATFSLFALAGSKESPLSKITGESIEKRAVQTGRGIDRLLNHRNPQKIAQIDAAIATNAADHELMKVRGGGAEAVRTQPGRDRFTSRIASYLTLDGLYTVITANALFAFTRIFGPLFGKDNVAEPVSISPAQFAAQTFAPMPPTTDATPKPGTQIAQSLTQGRVTSASTPELTA